MKHKINIINGERLYKRLQDVENGKAFAAYIDAEDFEIPFTDVKPIESFETPENFPKCCIRHITLYNSANSYYENFPNCCDIHKKLLLTTWFKKENYKELPDKVVKTIAYSEFIISERIGNQDWLKDITNYIEYCIYSYGQLPSGYGVVGLQLYTDNLRAYTEHSKHVPKNKKEAIIDFLCNWNKSEKDTAIDLNILHAIYKKWMNTFPFGISYFRDLKQNFEKQFPVLDGGSEINPYIGIKKMRAVSHIQLIEMLLNKTKQLLQSVSSAELLKKEHVSNVRTHRIELLNESHRVAQSSLLDNYSIGEIVYVRLLKKWLSNEKNYFNQLVKINAELEHLDNENAVVETKASKLKAAVGKFGFYELPSVKCLSENGKEGLINLISENKLPYQIAMFDYLKFIQHLELKHFTIKHKMFKEISKWLDSDKDGRTVKANISSLLKNTSENKSRYTAHLHKESVKTDYQNLK